MFNSKVKSICASFALAVVVAGGPIGCTSTPSAISDGARQFSMVKTSGDYTIRAVDQSMLAHLDGIKLLSGKGPRTDHRTKFDVAVEVQGVGVQFANEQTFGYVRADRTFTNDHRVGISFRFQF